MKAILDSSIFFSDCPVTGDLYTTPSVCEELIDIRSKGKFEKFSAEGLKVVSPSAGSREIVTIAAKKTRDTCVISDTDCDLLALALDLDAVLHTDDFAIQNVAGVLGVQTIPINQRKAKRIHWKYRCGGCGRYFDHDGECLICGSIIKRKLKYLPENLFPMSSLDDLIGRAKLLLAEGHSPGQIADELSLSMETVTWLLTQGKGTAAPKDVHIDWTAVSSQAPLLEETALMLLQRYYGNLSAESVSSPAAEVIVGIALSGIPLATIIAVQEAAKLAIYHPAKQNQSERPMGSISGNFAAIGGERCIIIDDTITSGNTMREVVKYLKKHDAIPVAIWVIFDKRGIKDIDGVPVYSLYKISRID